MGFTDRIRNDAKLLAGQVADAASQGTWLLAAAIALAGLAIAFGLVLVATAGGVR